MPRSQGRSPGTDGGIEYGKNNTGFDLDKLPKN